MALLVQFSRWDQPASLERSVRAALSPLGPRVWTFRPHPLPSLPSDFLALEACPPSPLASRVISTLLSHDGIREVSRERLYRAPLPPSSAPPLRSAPSSHLHKGRRLQATGHSTPLDFIARAMKAAEWWGRGVEGRDVRVGIMDTGLNRNHSFLR